MNQPIRVLLADDSLIAREGWGAILEPEVDIAIVGEASTPPEALNKLKELDPDVVLMDLKWGADRTAGWTTIREMRKISDHVRIIAITAYDDLIADARNSGADTALTKEFTRDQLLNTIRESHKGQFDLRPAREPGDHLAALTQREIEVLRLVADGLKDSEVAEKLIITESTAKNHVRSILDKLEAKNRTHAVKIARERGIIA